MDRHDIGGGFSIERTGAGGVRLAFRDDARELTRSVDLNPSEWATAIAAVCDGGETATRYRQALAMHTDPLAHD